MKAIKSVRFNNEQFTGEPAKRGTKLTPNKKSGKQRHQLYQSLEAEEDDLESLMPHNRESALDYLDEDED